MGGLLVVQSFIVALHYFLDHFLHHLALGIKLLDFSEVVLDLVELALEFFQTFKVGVELACELVSVLLENVHQLVALVGYFLQVGGLRSHHLVELFEEIVGLRF